MKDKAMLIKTFKRDADTLIKQAKIKNLSEVMLVCTNPSDAQLKRAGFQNLTQDSVIVPSVIGKNTAFNLEGKWIIHKDLPKEHRCVSTVLWHWTEWNGDKQSRLCDICRDCYPRTFQVPPLEEICFIAEKRQVISNKIDVRDKSRLLNVVNLFVELFGSCDLVENLENIPPLRQVPWEILPPGERIGKMLEDIQRRNRRYKKTRIAEITEERLKLLMNTKPDERAIGHISFSNYIAFIFKEKHLVVLESLALDNATYLFDLNWEDFSKLTKKEILDGHFQKDRLIHSANWFKKMKTILK